MGYAFLMGVHFPLETPDQVARAEQLVAKDGNSDKYEIAKRFPNAPAPTPRLYCIAQGAEMEQIVRWVTTGEGEEP